jgi:hypothetical protein
VPATGARAAHSVAQADVHLQVLKCERRTQDGGRGNSPSPPVTAPAARGYRTTEFDAADGESADIVGYPTAGAT